MPEEQRSHNYSLHVPVPLFQVSRSAVSSTTFCLPVKLHSSLRNSLCKIQIPDTCSSICFPPTSLSFGFKNVTIISLQNKNQTQCFLALINLKNASTRTHAHTQLWPALALCVACPAPSDLSWVMLAFRKVTILFFTLANLIARQTLQKAALNTSH